MSEWRHPQADVILQRIDSPLRVGSTVRVKSGGPLMTVEGVGLKPGYESSADDVRCYWDDDRQKHGYGWYNFSADMLELWP
jgi:uncharacterized protein YodC (DUF2158 family)